MNEIDNCPICNTPLKEGRKVEDHFGSGESFQLKSCPKCQTLTTSPQPSESEIGRYYKTDNYISHGDSKGSLFDSLYRTIQNRNQNYKLNLIRKYSLGNNLLDFGAGAGSFAEYSYNKSFHVTAVEPDDKARNRISNDVETHSSLQTVNKSFDIITAYHVLEHVHQLHDTLEKFKSLLNRNGTIHLALPNYQSFDAQYYDTFWAGYDVPRHLYHFSQKGVHQLVSDFGLNLVGTHPLKFDSFYVSLLSEQYKNTNFAAAKGFMKGYISNAKARKSGEYSSLIYVITN